MALVSHRHNFVYLKTFKTGGTSTEMALERLCAPAGHRPSHAQPTIISDDGIIAARRHFAKEDTTGWVSHMPAPALREKLGEDVWDSYLKVASLRNPFDKAVSWFWFAHRDRKPAELADPIALFRDFLKSREAVGHFRSRNDVDWRVCTIGGRVIVDRPLRLETLEVDLTDLCGTLGVDIADLPIPHVKNDPRSADRFDVTDYFDEPTADILRRNQDWIFELGGYSLNPADATRASSTPYVTEHPGPLRRIARTMRNQFRGLR